MTEGENKEGINLGEKDPVENQPGVENPVELTETVKEQSEKPSENVIQEDISPHDGNNAQVQPMENELTEENQVGESENAKAEVKTESNLNEKKDGNEAVDVEIQDKPDINKQEQQREQSEVTLKKPRTIKSPSLKASRGTMKTSQASSSSEMMGGEEILEEISSSETTIYLESLYEKRPEKCLSLHSLVPPKSWPSEADLSKDSDVYPVESEYIVATSSDKALKKTKTGKSLIREFSRLHIENIKVKEQVEPKVASVISIPPPQKAEVCFERSEELKEELVLEETTIQEESSEKGFPYLYSILELPLDRNKLQDISFNETLLISYDLYGEDDKTEECECRPVYHKSELFDPRGVQEMGGMCLSIETASCKLITYCTAQFSCLGTAGASRLLSIVDNGFSLIEEKKTEWHCTHENKIEKSLHVAKDGPGYVAFRTEELDGEVVRHRGDINFKENGDLLLDGGTFALMRYLIITNFVGEFETWSIHITGDICRCKFSVGKKKVLYINDAPYLTIRIKKELFRRGRYPDISKTYFLPTGHLVRHRWRGCRYFFHINPMGNIPPVVMRSNLEAEWKEDIILVSRYLDEKQKRRSEIQTYLGDNPEIKSILQDYMLCLLQLKPENILEFSIEYFTNLFRE